MASRADAATLVVNTGGDLQTALNAAQSGDEIVLQAGARFVGSFVLPPKAAGPVITIRSSATLPDRRLTAADATLLPTLVSPTSDPALKGTGSANWRIDGVRFESTLSGMYNIIHLQNADNITMDRLLIIGGASGQRRAIMGNGTRITLTRSHIANIWRSGEESQAFCAWDGAGPYTIRDNYLEAASQGILFGGANSASAANVPADILVEGNLVSKRPEWKGQPRFVKNLFELKSAKRAIIRNNVFENNWTDAQNGYAILFTVRNDEGGSPWSVIEDVLFERNVVRNTEGVFNVLGTDMYQPSGRSTRIMIRQNLLVGAGTLLQAGGEVGELTLDHNTADQQGNVGLLYTGQVWGAGTQGPRAAAFAVESLTITNTIANHGPYGLMGDSVGIGTTALAQLTRTYTWTNNVLAGESGWGQPYPPITLQPSMADHRAQFTTDYRLTASSTYRAAGTDGKDLGVLWDEGTTAPPPPPPPPTAAGGTTAAALTITTTSVPDMVLRQPYSFTLTASAPGQWRVSQGQLPAGITLSPGGTLSGVPTKNGAESFTLEVKSTTASATAAFSVRVRPK
jgi:hypothetical protein